MSTFIIMIIAIGGFGCASSGATDSGAAFHGNNHSLDELLTASSSTSMRVAGVGSALNDDEHEGSVGGARAADRTTSPPRSLVLPTEELRRLLAARGEAPGFDPDDWEYRRNDAAIGIPPGGPDDRRAIDTYAVIEYYDRYSVYGDRPSTYTERTIRSGKIPAQR